MIRRDEHDPRKNVVANTDGDLQSALPSEQFYRVCKQFRVELVIAQNLAANLNHDRFIFREPLKRTVVLDRIDGLLADAELQRCGFMPCPLILLLKLPRAYNGAQFKQPSSYDALTAQISIEPINRFGRARAMQRHTSRSAQRYLPRRGADDVVVCRAIGICLHFCTLDERESRHRFRIDIRRKFRGLSSQKTRKHGEHNET